MVHNEKLSDFYKSSSFVGTVKFKSLKWAGHVTSIDANNKTIQNFGGETSWQVEILETWRNCCRYKCQLLLFGKRIYMYISVICVLSYATVCQIGTYIAFQL